MVKAAYSEKLENNKARCHLCPAECLLTEGKVGICGCRYNRNGKMMTDNFGELVSAAYDPIEKKPLYHFYPGSIIFSTGPNGCNFSCDNCQNWEISQGKVPTRFVSPEDLVEIAGRHDSIGVAYTYSEPLVWYEYIMQAGKLVKEAGLRNVIVSNGYINPEPLADILPIIDAANIDLKGMKPKFYKTVCKGKLEPVLENIREFHEAGVWLEITNLVITDLNDSDDDFKRLVDFVAAISPRIPLHFSAYYPTHKMRNPPTPLDRLLRAFDIASEKLDYVYLGNVRLPGKSDTFCPKCRERLVGRDGYNIDVLGLGGGKCTQCGFDTGIAQ
ncbi:MAG: AmmeMemoRadiSam system radical SAM enzyme [Candidatus Zixiibacteriota bacterium]|nr:MAG: AmmeMemoRadiSam system radical SAM enzyme [candidate division Zixibacteria bacterium]